MTDVLPVGARVIYEFEGRRCPMVIVAHSPGPRAGDQLLYMAAEEPIEPPDAKLYSLDYLTYVLHAGWHVGHADRGSFTDTGERVKVRKHVNPLVGRPR